MAVCVVMRVVVCMSMFVWMILRVLMMLMPLAMSVMLMPLAMSVMFMPVTVCMLASMVMRM